jgi:hypothetical protein
MGHAPLGDSVRKQLFTGPLSGIATTRPELGVGTSNDSSLYARVYYALNKAPLQ